MASRLPPGKRGRPLRFELLENRTLLSASPSLVASAQAQPTCQVDLVGTADAAGSSTPGGLSPNQVRGAYGMGSYTGTVLSNGVAFSNGQGGQIPGDGRGQTIAIIDAYDDPNAASDLNAFSTYFGLPTFGGSGNPTFTKFNQRGQTTNLPGTDPNGPWSGSGGSTWEMEESLDIEWAHAMAPLANIDLFEAQTGGLSDLVTAVAAADGIQGVDVISMSWSVSEFSTEMADDSVYFTTPSGHLGGSAAVGGTELPGGITFLTSSGDSGDSSPLQYPSASPNVITVGGTSLAVSGSSPNYTWGSESGWADSGGGISGYERQPSYQIGLVSQFSTKKRTYPDVSADANPNTGVALYDSWDFSGGGTSHWLSTAMGGTSLACPLWAGMIAISDEGLAISGQGSLDGPTQTLPALYQLYQTPATYAADFHDITSGNNGYAAGTGYDLVTGIGSPIGNNIVAQLAGPSVTEQAGAALANPTTVDLSALGVDSGGASTLTYTWTATTLPSGASTPNFAANNGSNTAYSTTAALSEAGTYAFTVTITDALGLSVSSSTVNLTVNQTLASINVTPSGNSGFVATQLDQFGNPLANPSPLAWSPGGGGVALDLANGVTVNLEGVSPSFTYVTFNGTGYTIAQQGTGGTLQLANGASTADLNVAAGMDAMVSAPLVLGSNVAVVPAAGSQLTISGGVSGTGQSLNVDGPGTVVLTGTGGYTGGTTVSSGTLIVTSSSAIPTKTNLTVEGGGTFIFNPSFNTASNNATAASPAAAPVAVSAAAVATTPAIATDDASAATPTAITAATSAATAAVVSEETLAQPSIIVALSPAPPSAPQTSKLLTSLKNTAGNGRPKQLLQQIVTKAVPAEVSRPATAERHAGSSITNKSAEDLVWLGQAANSSGGSDLQKKEMAILALETVYAQYGG